MAAYTMTNSTTTARTRLRVGVTTGDPAGVGREIAFKAVADPRVTDVCEMVLYGPRTAAERERFASGVLSPDAGRVACAAVEQAVDDAMAGRLDAVANSEFPGNSRGTFCAGVCGTSYVGVYGLISSALTQTGVARGDAGRRGLDAGDVDGAERAAGGARWGRVLP